MLLIILSVWWTMKVILDTESIPLSMKKIECKESGGTPYSFDTNIFSILIIISVCNLVVVLLEKMNSLQNKYYNTHNNR